MASDSIVEEIKARIDIVELIGDYVELKRSGQNYKGRCPFHAEKTPSFMVSPSKQIFHCFGCGAGGDVFGFIVRHESLEFPDALRLLAKRAGVEVKAVSPKQKRERESLEGALLEAMNFFASCLKANKTAMNYLLKRGVSEDSIRNFTLGFSPMGWHDLDAHMKKKGFSPEILLRAGLQGQGQKGPYDLFRGRIMFPILNFRGEPVAFGGRGMDAETQPKYLNSPDSPLFKKGETLYAMDRAREAIRKAGRAMVVEGYMDAIMCHQYGLENTVAPLGTALTAGHLKQLGRLAGEVVLVFDGDAAGVNAARRSLALVADHDIEARVLMMPSGEDPDSLLKGQGTEAFQLLLEKALKPVEFFLSVAQDERTAMGEALDYISRVRDPIARDRHVLVLSEGTRISERAIREKLRALMPRSGGRAAGSSVRAYNEETLLLSAMLADKNAIRRVTSLISAAEIRDTLVRGLFELLAAGDVADPMESARNEDERKLISMLLMEPGFEMEEITQSIDDCVLKIRRRMHDAELKAIDQKLKDAQDRGDMEAQMALLNERKKLMQGVS